MGRTRAGWVISAVAPWCLGLGLVVSYSADAGQDASIGASLAPLSAIPAKGPGDLVPPLSGDIRMALALPQIAGDSIFHNASLTVGDEKSFRATPDEIEPRIKLKRHAAKFPRPVRDQKGDPFIGLRPTFDAKYRRYRGFLGKASRSELMFGRDFLAFEGFVPAEDNVPEAAAATPSAKAQGGSGATPQDSARRDQARPVTRGSARPVQLVSGYAQRYLDGATPAIPRAVALGSTTPVEAAANLRVVTAPYLPGMKPDGAKPDDKTTVAKKADRPNYAALVDHAKSPAQQKCLAEAIYFEARSEPEAGQAAVAQVVLNRVLSGLYPSTVCKVVYQNRHRFKACQFSFACEGKSLRITDRSSWATAVRIAKEVTEGKTYLAKVGGSTHYHANYVRPGWSRRLLRMNKIGAHIFYKLKPGQT